MECTKGSEESNAQPNATIKMRKSIITDTLVLQLTCASPSCQSLKPEKHDLMKNHYDTCADRTKTTGIARDKKEMTTSGLYNI